MYYFANNFIFEKYTACTVKFETTCPTLLDIAYISRQFICTIYHSLQGWHASTPVGRCRRIHGELSAGDDFENL